MVTMVAPLVLASASPRRQTILRRLGVTFEVQPSSEEEDARRADEAPDDYALRAAAGKVSTVVADRGGDRPEPYVLGADTVVVIDDDVLGKPRDHDAARDMVRALSGRWHRVSTAMVLGKVREGILGQRVVSTDVRFRELTASEVEAYVQSGEGSDKAGAYAVQGAGGQLVAELQGSRSNVIGLPATETLELLSRYRAVGSWP